MTTAQQKLPKSQFAGGSRAIDNQVETVEDFDFNKKIENGSELYFEQQVLKSDESGLPAKIDSSDEMDKYYRNIVVTQGAGAVVNPGTASKVKSGMQIGRPTVIKIDSKGGKDPSSEDILSEGSRQSGKKNFKASG